MRRPIRHNPSSPWFWVGGAVIIGGIAYAFSKGIIGSLVGKTVLVPLSALSAAQLPGIDPSLGGSTPCVVLVSADDGTTLTGSLVTLNGILISATARPVVQFPKASSAGTTPHPVGT